MKTAPSDRRLSAGWRVAIVEDHLLQRKRTEELIHLQPDLNVVWSGETVPAFTDWLQHRGHRQPPHLVLLDLMVDRQASVDPATVKNLLHAGLKVLVLSALASPPLVRDVIRAGVSGVLGKRDSEEAILSAIRTVLHGGEWMTPEVAAVIAGDASRPTLSLQEERTLILYASGMTLDDVAASIGVKPSTAKQYLNRVKAKYAAAGRAASTKVDLAMVAWQDGLLNPDLPHRR